MIQASRSPGFVGRINTWTWEWPLFLRPTFTYWHFCALHVFTFSHHYILRATCYFLLLSNSSCCAVFRSAKILRGVIRTFDGITLLYLICTHMLKFVKTMGLILEDCWCHLHAHHKVNFCAGLKLARPGCCWEKEKGSPALYAPEYRTVASEYVQQVELLTSCVDHQHVHMYVLLMIRVA